MGVGGMCVYFKGYLGVLRGTHGLTLKVGDSVTPCHGGTPRMQSQLSVSSSLPCPLLRAGSLGLSRQDPAAVTAGKGPVGTWSQVLSELQCLLCKNPRYFLLFEKFTWREGGGSKKEKISGKPGHMVTLA